MFERFTDRARRVIVLAQEEARLLGHPYVGTEHLLLGMAHEGEGVAAQTLTALNIKLEDVRHQVEVILAGMGITPSTNLPGHLPFTPRARKVCELSLREALQLGHNYIGTEHILLGLIREGEGVAASALVSRGAELSRVRQQVITTLSGYTGPADNPPDTVAARAASLRERAELFGADRPFLGFVNVDGVWLAYLEDWSRFAVFGEEIEALRCAVERSMKVVFLPYGADPRDLIGMTGRERLDVIAERLAEREPRPE